VDDRTSLEVPEITAQAPMGLAVLPEGILTVLPDAVSDLQGAIVDVDGGATRTL